MEFEWFKVIIISVILILILGILYLIDKKVKISSEIQRKAFHIMMGTIISIVPFILTKFTSVLLLGIICTISMELCKIPRLKNTIGKPLYGVKRKSKGEIFFAISMIVIFYLSKGEKILYTLSMLILTYSDSLSAIIGGKYGKHKLNIYGNKTLEGSLTFFLVTMLISSIVLNIANIENIVVISIIIASVTTILEMVSSGGTDNLFVPLRSIFSISKFYRKKQLYSKQYN